MARVPMPHIAKVSKPPAAPKFPAPKYPKAAVYKPPKMSVPKANLPKVSGPINAKFGRLFSYSAKQMAVKYPGPVRRTKGVI